MRLHFRSFRRAALAVAVCGCSASATYVTVPMSRAPAIPDASPDDGDALAVRVTFRPLPTEPVAERARGCRREVTCRPEEDTAVPVAYPPPFERCLTELGSPRAAFSPRETRDARRGEPHACCYVSFLGCSN